ncbi:glycosyltransferase family 4 protein [Nocardia sp. NPDC050435]|uniref:glycosyltransferase family 4 protein n=1 Tax=Nocardia sp. NPDC050435 TaxID=3155040 RepID=UPI0033E16ED3
MTRVVVTFGTYQGTYSGAERMAWRTVESLAHQGHDITVLTDSPSMVDVRCLPADTTELPVQPELAHAFDLGKPQSADHGWQLARRFEIPFALTPATDSSVWPDPVTGDHLCRQADMLFSMTKGEDGVLVGKGVSPDRITRIPAAPDVAGVANPERFRRAYEISGPLVLFVGRRIAFKGYRRLLETMPLVWQALPDTVFAFAGPNAEPDAAAIFQRHADPRMIDLGVVDEQQKHDAIAAADVLCLPSSAEVFPVVFAEAWRLGKPVVSGDFPGAHDVVRHSVDGFVVPPRPAAIASALVELITDPPLRAAMGLEGLRRAERELSWHAVATAVSAGYRRILGTTVSMFKCES